MVAKHCAICKVDVVPHAGGCPHCGARNLKEAFVKCSKCEYVWRPRVDNPKACPRCKARTDAVKKGAA